MQMRRINKSRKSMWCIHVLFTQACVLNCKQGCSFWTDTVWAKFSSSPVRKEINTVTTCSVAENDQREASFSHLDYSEGLSPEDDLSRPLSSILHVSATPPWLSSSFPSLCRWELDSLCHVCSEILAWFLAMACWEINATIYLQRIHK